MKKLSKETKFAHLGKPGTAFTSGFQRRLDIVLKHVDLKAKVILDQGCGEGVWMHEFERFTAPKNIYGMDIDPESVHKFEIFNTKFQKEEQIPHENIKVCTAEDLDFPDNTFDIIFSNEVLEHVVDDKKTVIEALRTLKPGGKFIIFTPNRGWPFETHGMFFRGKYYWGNIPLLPWMPKIIRKKFSPHVRNYGHWEINKIIHSGKHEIRTSEDEKIEETKEYTFKIIHHSHVFPGFDKLSRKYGVIGKIVQKFFYVIEKTPLNFFGISHFIIAEKIRK